MSSILSVVGFALTVIGALASIWFVAEKFGQYRRVSWRRAERLSTQITAQMISDGFVPTFIVGVARGGAIIGALVAGILGHRPIVAFTADHVWKNGRREDQMLIELKIKDPAVLERVLVIAGELHTGN